MEEPLVGSKEQDGEVIGKPFDAGLLFVQNIELQYDGKERVVTLRFLNLKKVESTMTAVNTSLPGAVQHDKKSHYWT